MHDRSPISVKTTQHGETFVVAAEGEIGYHEAPAFRAALRDAYDKKPKKLIADLSGVTYMATPGLATLVEALQIAKRHQTSLVLCGLTDRVRAVFEIARLHTVFRITPDLSQALAS